MSSDGASPQVLPFLNHDIMTYIFNLNTHLSQSEHEFISQSSALHTIRHTSQVCRSWRHIVLQSPAIWGNMIDLDILGEASEEWFEEVVKRTGKASLSIHGQVDDFPAIKRLLFLLEENWDRVGRLNVVLFEGDPDIDFDRFYDICWKRQAPILEEFIVSLYGTRSSDERKWKNFKLFNGSAPLLRRIHCPDFHFDQHASWITQLVAVTLSGPLKMIDVLHVLVKTPLLESLAIESTIYYDDDSAHTWKQNIQLPNLRLITIGSDIAGSLVYLSLITPSSGCALKVTVDDDSIELQTTDNKNLRRLLKTVLAYVEGYFRVKSAKKVVIYIGNPGVGFETYEMWDEDDGFEYGSPDFEVSLGPKTTFGQTFNPALADMIFATLAPAALNKVHTFEFTVYHSSWVPTTDAVVQIFRSLTSVKNMKLTPWALHGLNGLSDSVTLFPELAEVTIDYQTRVRNLDEILRVFLTRRKEVGTPLQTLYKPDNSRPKGAKHWRFLKQFEGLRVISTGEGDDSDDSYEGEDDSDDEDDEDGSSGEGDDGDDNERGDDDDEDTEDEDM